MARRKRFHVLILLPTLLLPLTGRAEVLTRQLNLRTGDSEEVTYPPGTDLSVSRRGIVDVFHAGDGHWQITALHGGFVVIDARDAGTGEPRWPRLLIDVPSAGEAQENSQAELPAWLCTGESGVTCDRSAGIVQGRADSLPWFLRARAACSAARGCFFSVKLTDATLAAWISELRQALGEGYTVAATAAGIPVLEVFCGKGARQRRIEEADALTGRAVTDGLAVLRCREEASTARYRLSARIFLVEAAAARELGFDGSATVQLSTPGPASEARLLSQLKALATDHKAEMLGQPVVRLIPNEETQLASGGEFQVIEHVLSETAAERLPERSSWKQHGLTLKVTALPLAAGRVRLAYDMTFKTKTSTADTALAVNSVKSDVDLSLDTPTMVAALDMHATGSDGTSVPVLAHIPLIGPLFARDSSQDASSRLVLWLDLSTDGDSGDLTVHWP